MDNREKLTRLVIEKIWSLPYDEAILKELKKGCKISGFGHKGNDCIFIEDLYDWENITDEKSLVESIYETYHQCLDFDILGLPITLPRIMYALGFEFQYILVKTNIVFICPQLPICIASNKVIDYEKYKNIHWQLFNNGKEVNIYSQKNGQYIISENTIKSLINFLDYKKTTSL